MGLQNRAVASDAELVFVSKSIKLLFNKSSFSESIVFML